MSIAATNWALKQRTDGPSAQIVLFVVADAANERGICRHADPDYLAERTRQSRATVFRRLGELERAGALTRFKLHGPRGEAIYEIRLHLDREIDYARPVADADDDVGGEVSDAVARDAADEAGAVSGGAESQFETLTGETGGVSPVRLAESHSCDSKSPSKSPTSPLKPPPHVGPAPQGSAREDDDTLVADLAAYRAAHPGIAKRPFEVEALMAALTPAERRERITGASGYAATLAKRPKAHPVDPAKFLREGLWAEYVRHAPPPPRTVFVAAGTPQADAWAVYAATCGRFRPQPTWSDQHGARGWLEYTEWPPFGRGFDPTPAQWWFVERGTRECAAWSERIHQLVGRVPDFVADRPTDRDRASAGLAVLDPLRGTEPLGDGRRFGRRVPCRWPPRRDGTPCTGPPGDDAAVETATA